MVVESAGIEPASHFRYLVVGPEVSARYAARSPGRRRGDAPNRQFPGKQPVGNLRQDAAAVAGAVSRFCASMLESHQALDRQSGQPIRGLPIARSNEADATSVVFKTGVV